MARTAPLTPDEEAIARALMAHASSELAGLAEGIRTGDTLHSAAQTDANNIAYLCRKYSPAYLATLVVAAARMIQGRDETQAPDPATLGLTWTTSDSADEANHDQETNLDAIGNPGGAVWASVSPVVLHDQQKWAWVIYNCWTDVDEHECELAAGRVDTEGQAKAAVTEWVRAALS